MFLSVPVCKNVVTLSHCGYFNTFFPSQSAANGQFLWQNKKPHFSPNRPETIFCASSRTSSWRHKDATLFLATFQALLQATKEASERRLTSVSSQSWHKKLSSFWCVFCQHIWWLFVDSFGDFFASQVATFSTLFSPSPGKKVHKQKIRERFILGDPEPFRNFPARDQIFLLFLFEHFFAWLSGNPEHLNKESHTGSRKRVGFFIWEMMSFVYCFLERLFLGLWEATFPISYATGSPITDK